MKKVKLYFPREMKWRGVVYEGDKVHEISEEIPGLIARWLKRGCTEVVEKVEPPKEVKPFRKKTTKKKKTEKVEKEDKEDHNIEETNE